MSWSRFRITVAGIKPEFGLGSGELHFLVLECSRNLETTVPMRCWTIEGIKLFRTVSGFFWVIEGGYLYYSPGAETRMCLILVQQDSWPLSDHFESLYQGKMARFRDKTAYCILPLLEERGFVPKLIDPLGNGSPW